MRALVLAPFFSHESTTNRPLLVSEVLARFGPVDILTTDFDHHRKSRKPAYQFDEGGRTMHYLPTPAYRHNVSVARFVSHLAFTLRAWRFFRRRRREYDVVYATLPLNLLALLCFRGGEPRLCIADVVDIWPDVLPFSRSVKQLLAPLFAIWQRSFTAAVASADLLLAVSDRFLQESLPAFRGAPDAARRLYIGHPALLPVPHARDEGLTIAYVGNIGHLCDLETLLDALTEWPTPPRLLLVGDGDRRAWLLDALARHAIPHEYFGVIYDDATLAGILARADLGFNGYLNTAAAFSYKANTYLAAGLPLLNSMSGDLHDIVVEREVGFNYKAGNAQSLAHCLRAATPATLDRLRVNAERFFAESLDHRRLKAELESWLCGHLRVLVG